MGPSHYRFDGSCPPSSICFQSTPVIRSLQLAPSEGDSPDCHVSPSNRLLVPVDISCMEWYRVTPYILSFHELGHCIHHEVWETTSARKVSLFVPKLFVLSAQINRDAAHEVVPRVLFPA